VGRFALEFVIAAGLVGSGVAVVMRRSNPSLPFFLEALRRMAVIYLAVFKRFHSVNDHHIPESGPLILVANHTSVFDPICLQVACRNRWIRFMEAREYYERRPMHYLYRLLRVIPVNRNGNDTASIRATARELSNNGCVGIFPEGRISDDGQLHEARHGVALLAMLSNATVVPAYLDGANPFSSMILDFFRLNRVTLIFGPPIRFDDLLDQHRDKESREVALKRIMNGIAALKAKSQDHAGDLACTPKIKHQPRSRRNRDRSIQLHS